MASVLDGLNKELQEERKRDKLKTKEDPDEGRKEGDLYGIGQPDHGAQYDPLPIIEVLASNQG